MATLVNYYLVPKTHFNERSRIAHIPLPADLDDAGIATLVSNYETLSEGTGGSAASVFGVTEAIYNTKAVDDVIEDDDLVTVNPVGINALIANLDGVTHIRRTNPVQLKGLHPMPDATPPFAGTAPADIYKDFLTHFARLVYRNAVGTLEFAPVTEVIINKTFKMH